MYNSTGIDCHSPILFNIFINDIFYSVDFSTIYNYADDNTLSYADYDLKIAYSHMFSRTLLKILASYKANILSFVGPPWSCCMVVGYTTTCAISVYHNFIWNCIYVWMRLLLCMSMYTWAYVLVGLAHDDLCLQIINQLNTKDNRLAWFGLWCLTPFSTIFQLYRDGSVLLV
jgi:hypothetical protein